MLRQLLVSLAVHDGVHKETARIAHHLRVRQLRLTNRDDRIPQLLGRRVTKASPPQFLMDITIVETRRKFLLQHIGHRSDQIFVLPVFLKPTLTIGILAGSIADGTHLACCDFHRIQFEQHVLHLDTIGTDILHSRSTHIARYQREVFHAIETVTDAQGDHIVPHLATATAHLTGAESHTLHG